MQLLQAKANSFEHAVIYRVSVAAAPLAAWVKANVKYSLVLEKIAPLEAELDHLRASLESSKQRVEQCESDLIRLDKQARPAAPAEPTRPTAHEVVWRSGHGAWLSVAGVRD